MVAEESAFSLYVYRSSSSFPRRSLLPLDPSLIHSTSAAR